MGRPQRSALTALIGW